MLNPENNRRAARILAIVDSTLDSIENSIADGQAVSVHLTMALHNLAVVLKKLDAHVPSNQNTGGKLSETDRQIIDRYIERYANPPTVVSGEKKKPNNSITRPKNKAIESQD